MTVGKKLEHLIFRIVDIRDKLIILEQGTSLVNKILFVCAKDSQDRIGVAGINLLHKLMQIDNWSYHPDFCARNV
ncbi:hypothetical protein [Paenibacillus sp. OV219]|uniref:hypothetical protein n=1 Tax=Paenibacillus sp. OV219 TaxID=1884377 RepID=UPI0008D6A378|nr:hypothetical protein [Paenibacillus sp. OV219]SEN15618.1 hypothetical protein SAMN05518847_102292 [Paenibacillus sp. OV219]